MNLFSLDPDPVRHYVVGLAFSATPDENERFVVLLRKTRPAWQAGLLNGPGGAVEPGEQPLQAMRREFREETGVDVAQWTAFATQTGVSDDGDAYRIDYFKTILTIGEYESLGSPTDEEVETFRVTSIIQEQQTFPYASRNLLVDNLRYLLPMAVDPDAPFAEIRTQAQVQVLVNDPDEHTTLDL